MEYRGLNIYHKIVKSGCHKQKKQFKIMKICCSLPSLIPSINCLQKYDRLKYLSCFVHMKSADGQWNNISLPSYELWSQLICDSFGFYFPVERK